jgi:hypothetical protein
LKRTTAWHPPAGGNGAPLVQAFASTSKSRVLSSVNRESRNAAVPVFWTTTGFCSPRVLN